MSWVRVAAANWIQRLVAEHVTVFGKQMSDSVVSGNIKGNNSGGGISPDDKKVLYTAPEKGVQQIFIFDLVNREAKQLTLSPGDKADGTWSPDGKSIAFFSNLGGALQLWKMAADGTHQQQLTTGYERIRHAFFAPNGRWLYYQPSHRNIFRMPVNGGAAEQVTRFPDVGLFIEEPIIWPDGKYLLYTRSNGGASLWLLKLR